MIFRNAIGTLILVSMLASNVFEEYLLKCDPFLINLSILEEFFFRDCFELKKIATTTHKVEFFFPLRRIRRG